MKLGIREGGPDGLAYFVAEVTLDPYHPESHTKKKAIATSSVLRRLTEIRPNHGHVNEVFKDLFNTMTDLGVIGDLSFEAQIDVVLKLHDVVMKR